MSGFPESALAGNVYLVGAGPGSVDLLTVRAHRLISTASCVLHDDLVSAEVLALARPGALVQNVGKRCGEKTITQEQINAWMVQNARAGHGVVRLKSGDPLLFGRAAEEIAALAESEIRFEIIPGVSAGFAAAAAAAVPLTGRISNSRVLFATRHLSMESGQGNRGGLAGITPEVTLVLYMPGRDYASVAAELLQNGWPGQTRCLLASSVGTAAEQQRSCLLTELASESGLPSPVVMVFLPPAI